jgi:hypothetical protein
LSLTALLEGYFVLRQDLDDGKLEGGEAKASGELGASPVSGEAVWTATVTQGF